ncbi:MAG TPA: zf-TFIIB domain-containing protein [Nevskiaceae bacterium]|nr:zf-TFIIB domain-containing protein [Nevskiaceae bacterium]
MKFLRYAAADAQVTATREADKRSGDEAERLRQECVDEQETPAVEVTMKCPKCNLDLVPQSRHKIDMNFCPSCKGMWLDAQELDELENEAFDLGEHDKGTLVFSSTPTTKKCPSCATPLQRFNYRDFDLEMEFCPNRHGYWLDADEDTRVLALMKKEEHDEKRDVRAEAQWGQMMRHMRSGSFLTKLKNLFR